MTRLLTIFSFALILAASACGGDDDGDGSNDAPNLPDAGNSTPDAAPAALMGLGQTCSEQMPCTAPLQCLTNIGEAVGFCSKQCATGFKATTNAEGLVSLEGVPAANHQDCANDYSGTAGLAACAAIIGVDPAPNQDGGLTPDMEYTFDLACAIACDQNMACPGGFTCNTMTGLCDQN